MRLPTLTIALGLWVFGAFLSSDPDARAQSFQTCPGSPSTTGLLSLLVNNDGGLGFGQSFRIPFSGRLDGLVLDTVQVPNAQIHFLWTLNLVEVDGTIGSALASGEFDYVGNGFGNQPLEFGFSPGLTVEAGQTLFFGLRRQVDATTGGAGLSWLVGSSATNTAPYPHGEAYSRPWNGDWEPMLAQGYNRDLRLTAYLEPCVGPATAPTVSIDPIHDDVGVDHVTLSGTASDPDRIKQIWLDGGAAPIQTWTTANASLSPTFSLPIPASGGPASEVISGYVVDFCGTSTPFQTTATYGDCVAESLVCAADALGYVFYVDVVPATDGCVIRCQTDAQGQNLQCALQCDL